MKKSKTSVAVIAVLALVALASIGAAGYFYNQAQNLKNNPKAVQEQQKQQAADLKAKVSKLIDLPKDESPTIATVSDKTKLKNQPFFKDADNGDQILIFPQAKKAIIYREKEDKLINVGPIAITSETTQSDTSKTNQ
jgi:type II secretory pathway pseudopilin PulG